MTYDIDQRVRARTRHALLWLVAGLVVVVAATVVIVLAAQDTEPSGDGPEQGARPPNLGDAGQNQPVTVSQSEVEKITWAQSHGVWFPISTSSGPKNRNGGLASGFTRDPLGAVLAAVHIGERAGASGGPRIFEPTIKNQVIGKNSEKFLVEARKEYEQKSKGKNVANGEPLDTGSSAYAGFQIEHYEASYAAIHVLLESDRTTTEPGISADFRIEVRWVDGDWRVVAPVDETWASSMSPAQQRNVYTMFPERG